MKDWFKKRIWNWLFAKDAAEEQLRLSQASSTENAEYNTSKEFLGQMLRGAEQDFSRERIKSKSLEEKVQLLQNKLKELDIPDAERRPLKGIEADFFEKYSKRYSKDLKIYIDKSNMKIKFIPIADYALPPAKLNKTDSTYAMFTPGMGDIVIGPEEDTQLSLGFKLIIPEGYVGKIHTPKNMNDQSTFSINDQLVESNRDEEVVLRVVNRSKENQLRIPAGREVAQFSIEKVEKAEFVKNNK